MGKITLAIILGCAFGCAWNETALKRPAREGRATSPLKAHRAVKLEKGHYFVEIVRSGSKTDAITKLYRKAKELCVKAGYQGFKLGQETRKRPVSAHVYCR